MDGDACILVAGHRRLKAVMELISEGETFDVIWALAEAKGRTEDDRDADLLNSNSGQPLSQLDKGTIFKRRVARGISHEAIALSNGITVKQVKNLIDLTAAPEPIKAMIAEGQVSATLALHEFQTKGPTAAVESLKQDIADAAEQGKTKVTAGTQAKAAAKSGKPKTSFLNATLAEMGVEVETPAAQPNVPAVPAGPIERNGFILPKTSAEKFKAYWEVLCEAMIMDDLTLVKSMIGDTLKKAAA